MHRLSLLFALVLLACARPAPAPQGGPYRPVEAPIYSNAVLDPARLVGDWQQVAGFGAAACAPGQVSIRETGAGLGIHYRLCQSGSAVAAAGPMVPVGPGRFDVPGQPGPWWVLWADADDRTLVIGTPGGEIGFILNRGDFPPDRLAAAKEILDWNGYDLGRLHVY